MTNIEMNELIEWYSNDEENKLTSDEKFNLIRETKNKKFIKKCIKELRIGLTNSDRIRLLKDIEDKKFTDECIRNKELGFSGLDKVELIRTIMGDGYIEKLTKLALKDNDFDETVMAFLILRSGNMKLIKQNPDVITRKFNLPEKMTIGMEIESEGYFCLEIKDNFCFGEWNTVSDSSLQDGVEVISPKLHPTEKAISEIYIVNNALSKLGQSISDRCGGHIHIGADYLTSKQSYINLMEIWCNTEKILYAICNEENTFPREKIDEYAKPITEKVLEKGSINLTNEMELDEFIDELKKVQGYTYIMGIPDPDRHSGINFINVNNGKNTIEFRLANGTLNPDLWMDNINLFGGIIAVSEELSKIYERGIESEEERVKIEMFESLKTGIDEVKKLDILLKLVGVEPTEYKNRYESNIKLIDSNSKLLELFPNDNVTIDIMEKIKMKSVEDVALESSALLEKEVLKNFMLLMRSVREKGAFKEILKEIEH